MTLSKLLYVDDDEINLINFKIAFRSHFHILTALSGTQALELFHANRDLAIVVADQKMPHMTGVTLLGKLHRIDPGPVRIILTAYSDAQDIIEAINQGHIYEYILKPWNEDRLLLTLQKAENIFLLARDNKRLLAELKEKNKELEATNLQLKTNMEKRQKMEKTLFAKQVELAHAGRLSALGEMASGIAHEIHQPLTVIQLAAEGLSLYFADRDQDSLEMESLKDILAQIKRAEKIIKNVRTFSHADFGGMQCVDPAKPVNNSLSFFREQFRAHAIELQEKIDTVPKIKTDPQKFEQIVVNFLSNSRYAVLKQAETSSAKYCPQVTVRLFQGSRHMADDTTTNREKWLFFEVEDNGMGMDEKTREHCLEPFFTTKEVGEGTGLGLSIVHGIARELKMKLEIESSPDQGSLFRLLIPMEGC